jgi:hypothetical protein
MSSIHHHAVGTVVENGINLDWVLGGLAGAIAIGGLLMLATGVKAMNDDEKPKK